MRATIIVDVTVKEEVTAAEAWMESHRAALTFVSAERGCGCCVRIWDLEGPDDVIGTIPPEVNGGSEWTREVQS